MLIDVERIITRITFGDELGIYREATNKQIYLLFVCTQQTETIKLGRELARLIHKPFVNQLPDIVVKDEEDQLLDTEVRVEEFISNDVPVVIKRKKVMGIHKMCLSLVKAGETDIEIIEELVVKYTDSGYTREKGVERILDTLYYIRKDS